MHAREAIPYNLGKQAPEDAVNRLATYVSDKGGYRQNACLERGAKGFGFQFVMGCRGSSVRIRPPRPEKEETSQKYWEVSFCALIAVG